MDEFIRNEMEDRKEAASTRLNSVFQNDNDLVNLLIEGWMESLPSAIKIAEDYNFEPMDFYAIDGQYECFKDEWIKDRHIQACEEAYDRSCDKYEL